MDDNGSMLKNRLASFFTGFIPNCDELTQLASESLDRRLSLKERILIRLHLGMCVLCRRYHRQLRVIHEALKENPDNFTEAYQVTLSADRKARLKKLIETGPQEF